MHTYIQALTVNVKDILKLKENFPNLLAKKIENIHNIINKTNKPKSHINMTTKDLSHKQIIVFMNSNNNLIISLILSGLTIVVSLSYPTKSCPLLISM